MTATVPPQIRLANEIAAQFGHQPADVAARAVAAHIRSFWEPRMRADLLRRIGSEEADGRTGGVDPLVLAAAALLR